MSTANPNPNPAPGPDQISREFFTAEIQDGGSAEYAQAAAFIIETALELAVAQVRLCFAGKKNAPRVIIHRPGRVQA